MSEFSFVGIEKSKFEKRYNNKVVLSNKDALIKWLNDSGINKLNSKKSLELDSLYSKKLKKELSLYERAAWSRSDDNGKVKIRLEVRGKAVFFSEEDAINNNAYLCDNDYGIVKSLIENMIKQLGNANDDLTLYYRSKDEDKKLVIMKM
jgi:hypothetical protein